MPDPQQVEKMFDRIAGRYDLVNRIMTMGVDRRWRRHVIRTARIERGTEVLDVCCGTGDLSLLAARSGADVTGLDFSANMLAQARERSGAEHVTWVQGDALDLPFADHAFDALTIGFGARNLADLAGALHEFRRVLRPGGRMVCLDITRPSRQPFRTFYSLWFDRIVPRLGGAVSGDREAYEYLPQSTKMFPRPAALANIMRDAGFEDVRYRSFAGGIVVMHEGAA